jgi:flagellar FliJ protein
MTQALHTLLDLAERERDEAATRMAQAEQAAQAQRLQWDQLQAYHADYAARSPALGGRAAPIELLKCHGAFMERLHQALTHQQRAVEAAEATLVQRRQQLLALETRLASVKKLLERRSEVAALHLHRQDQRRADEAAMQRHWHQRVATH